MSDGFEYCRECEYFDNTNPSCTFWGESCYGTTFCAVKLRKQVNLTSNCKVLKGFERLSVSEEQEHEKASKEKA